MPKHAARILEHTQFGVDELLGFASKMLNNGGDVHGCALRIACWTAQSGQEDALKTWGKMMSNQLVSAFVNATAVEEAITYGRQGRDCTVYSPCPLKTDHYSNLMKNLAVLTKANR
ncbi:hypothetical protein MSG28_006771 [Choristoneura fumiferana]|uniref:Uncharacterized protein n=2 Tax=Choristoneura fumiferana TaxID=7141 RepID=A0ACC0JLB6_CHOFU|nr:hypothetical protein MSG28_006767 [Choristoneura fumiferana]KAI8424847.1 hypothetical protein MSG28_006771 [Choristoneura fumiferana]